MPGSWQYYTGEGRRNCGQSERNAVENSYKKVTKTSKKQLTKACQYNIICKYDVRRNSLHQSPGVNLFSIESTMKIISKPKFIGGQPMKTYMANPDKIERKWYVVDAEGQTLGRLAAEVAKVLRGKNKPEFTPHIDTGDNVIVINA